MSNYDEPKNGDFARYVEALTQRESAPISAQPRRQLPPAPANPAPVMRKPAGHQHGPIGQNDASPGTTQSSPSAPTLAQRANQRQTASGLRFFGFLALCLTLWNLGTYADSEHTSFMRILMPGLVAFWCFRSAARSAARAKLAPQEFAPLKLPPKP